MTEGEKVGGENRGMGSQNRGNRRRERQRGENPGGGEQRRENLGGGEQRGGREQRRENLGGGDFIGKKGRAGQGGFLPRQPRTDLALEERESIPGDGGEVDGVSLREWADEGGQVKLSEVRIFSERGAVAMGKPQGTYLTLEADQLARKDEDYHQEVARELARQIRRLAGGMTGGSGREGENLTGESMTEGSGSEGESLTGESGLEAGKGKGIRKGFGGGKKNGQENRGEGEEEQGSEEKQESEEKAGMRSNLRILAVGLGNSSVTPDALGPRVVGHLQVTRHLEQQYGEGFCRERGLPVLSGIVPGVMAQTGMETAEILKGIIQQTSPDLLLVIDALAARSIRRLCATIQLTDTGIHPGSGVGNHRHSLTRESLGIPVLAIGVPTVVGAAAIVHDTVDAMIQALSSSRSTKGMGDFVREMSPEEQYDLIRELLEPQFGSFYVTPPNIDEMIEQLSYTISEGIHQAIFPNQREKSAGV